MHDPVRTDGKLLIVTAVQAEAEAIQRGLDAVRNTAHDAMCAATQADAITQANATTRVDARDMRDEARATIARTAPARGADVLIGGVGPASAAASTARALALNTYDLVVSAGIGGAFPGMAEIGSIIVASEIIAADLGAETAEGFADVEQLGFGAARLSVAMQASERLVGELRARGLPVQFGPVLTVSTATGTEQTAAARAARTPGATGEAMEGFGVAVAARAAGVPVLEIRAVSNMVGPRNRDAWRIPEALRALERASSIMLEVLM